MSMVPMKDTLIVQRPQGFDRWGEPLDPIEIPVKARIDFRVEIVKDQQGKDAISRAQILLDKLADIQYEDTLTWTDELGNRFVEKPISIQPIKNINGKVVVTKVVV